MSVLFLQEQSEWVVLPLAAGVSLSLSSRLPRRVGDAAASALGAPIVSPAAARGDSEWVLLCRRSGAVQLNGIPLATGLRVLRDRDEIRVRSVGTFFFSTERLAEVVPFPGAAHPVACARCRQDILAGTDAVCCPRCFVWHHQSEQRPCWTYAETCAMCPTPTALDAGYAWSPDHP